MKIIAILSLQLTIKFYFLNDYKHRDTVTVHANNVKSKVTDRS